MTDVALKKKLLAEERADARKKLVKHFIEPVVAVLVKTGISPNVLTVSGFVVNVAAAVLIAYRQLPLAAVMVILGGVLDMLDGALARKSHRESRFGAVLDSTLDRLSDGMLILSVLVYYAAEISLLIILLVAAALVFSYLVSYIRARAEGMGLSCRVGIFTRTERIIIIILGLLTNQLLIAVGIIAVMSLITAGQRLYAVYRATLKNSSGG